MDDAETELNRRWDRALEALQSKPEFPWKLVALCLLSCLFGILMGVALS